MQNKIKALGVCFGLMAVLVIQPAMGVTTVVFEDFESGVPGEVPAGWTSLGGTPDFSPGIDDYRASMGLYDGGQTMALTNPFIDSYGSANGMVGAIVYNTPVDIQNNKLLVEFDLLVSPGESVDPADGCAMMVLPSIPTAPGATGGGLGWSGLGGFAVEFDIYDNGDADPDDLVSQTAYQAVFEVGTLDGTPARQVGVNAAWHRVWGDAAVYSTLTHDADGNLAVYPNVPDFVFPMEASVVVHVWVEYDNGYIKVEMEAGDPFGGFPEFDFPRDTVVEGAIGPWWFHGGGEDAFVGFSGAIGGSNAMQEVDNLLIAFDPTLGEEQFNDSLITPEIDATGKVAETGITAEEGWNLSVVKMNANEYIGQTIASSNNLERTYKTSWVLDHFVPIATDTPLLVNHASCQYAANANNMFDAELPYPGIDYLESTEWANTEEDPVPEELKVGDFAVRATGFIEFPEPGIYLLGVTHDDNFAIFISGKRLFQNIDPGTDVFKVSVPEAGVYPIQVDLAEQGWYSYFSIFEVDPVTAQSSLVNDGSRVRVFLEVPEAEIPPTDYTGLEDTVLTVDPAAKVGEVGEGINPGFNYEHVLVSTNTVPYQYQLVSPVMASALFDDPVGVGDLIESRTEGVVQVVNWSGTGEDAGGQPGDATMPGGQREDQAIRVSGFAEFPTAGWYLMHVNSDDGFEAGIGSQRIQTAGLKGTSDVAVYVIIQEPGLYPLQITYFERGGGKSFEFTQWLPSGGVPTLVNSEDATVKVYTDAPGAENAEFYTSYQSAISGACVDSGFNVRFIKHPGGVENLTQCKELLAGLRAITYEDISIQPVIDFWSSAGQGNFETNIPFPTLQLDVESDNDFALEATGFIELTAGWHRFGVNSDDGFGLYINGFTVAEAPDGKGVSNVDGNIFVTKTGLYPILLQYWEGGGGAACELYYHKADGTLVAVNDTANGGPAVCTAIDVIDVEAPVITSLTLEGGNIVVTWEGGTPPYQFQVTDDLSAGWANMGEPTNETSVAIPTTTADFGFLRVVPAVN